MILTTNGPQTQPNTPDEQTLMEEAFLASADPIEWLGDATLWLINAQDITKAQIVYGVWQQLGQEREELLANLLALAIDAANQAMQQEAQT